MCLCLCVSGYLPNGMPPGEYVDAATGAMMTSRPMTSLPAAVGGAKCQQPMGAQFSQQVTGCFMYTGCDEKTGPFFESSCIYWCREANLQYTIWSKSCVLNVSHLYILCISPVET